MSAQSYAPEEEDFFSGKEQEKLDTWVFDKVKDFFEEAQESVELQMQLREDKVVLFLHLLGLDSNGHVNGPKSDVYLNNLRVVDQGVKEVRMTLPSSEMVVIKTY